MNLLSSIDIKTSTHQLNTITKQLQTLHTSQPTLKQHLQNTIKMYAQTIVFGLLAATGALAAPAPGALEVRTYNATACASTCTEFHNECVAREGSNKSLCASNYAECLGYSPYESGSLVEPTACSFTTTATATAAACADLCNQEHNACVADPDSNKSLCASNYAQCLGYSPYTTSGPVITATACSYTSTTPAATPTSVISPCYVTYAACLAEQGSNKSLCASNYAGCLGYNPFTSPN